MRPGEENLAWSLPEPAARSVALGHLDGIAIGEGGHFVYERDVIEDDDETDEFEFDA